MKTYDDLLRQMIEEFKERNFFLTDSGRIREVGSMRCPLEVVTKVPRFSFATFMRELAIEGYSDDDLISIVVAADDRRGNDFSPAIRQDLLTACGLITEETNS